MRVKGSFAHVPAATDTPRTEAQGARFGAFERPAQYRWAMVAQIVPSYGRSPMAIEARTTTPEPAPEPPRERAGTSRRESEVVTLGKLFDRHLPTIYAFVARRVEERDAAERLTAATFERGMAALRDEEVTEAGLGGFLYRVAASAVIDHERRSRKRAPAGVRAGDFDRDGDRRAAESVGDEIAMRALAVAIDRSRLRRAIQGLPDADRRILVLRYLDGLDVDEVCAVLACSRQTFAVQLHRALRALRAAVSQEVTDAA